MQYFVRIFFTVISPHGIAMPKGLYFTTVVFSSFFFSTPNLLKSLNGPQPNLDTFNYDNYLNKFGSNSPRHLPPPPRAGDKKRLGTDFEFWPNISLQRNMISLYQQSERSLSTTETPLHAPEFGELRSKTAENGWRIIAHHTPYIFALGDTASLTAWTIYITDSTCSRVM